MGPPIRYRSELRRRAFCATLIRRALQGIRDSPLDHLTQLSTELRVDRLTQLPIELRAEILQHLPNFPCLFSAIQAHRNMYNAYHNFDRQILHIIFGRQCDETERNNTGQVFLELVFAIRHAFIKREIVGELFTIGWKLFRTRDQEEFLLPLGRALAWSYWQEGGAEIEAKTTRMIANEDEDGVIVGAKWEEINKGGNRKTDAVSLLQKLVYRQEPFDQNPPPTKAKDYREFQQRWPSMAVLPVLGLLNKLTRNEEAIEVCKRPLLLAEVNDRGVFLLDCPKAIELRLMVEILESGIVFTKGRAIVGVTLPGRIPFTKK
ncbi:hypothetical protein VTK26DRAFT_8301 [Humicola hyalothermophila]